jgi:hypothetical protein
MSYIRPPSTLTWTWRVLSTYTTLIWRILLIGGPDVSSRQFFFRTKKIEGPKFHVTRTSDSRKIKSLITSPTPTWRCTLPRTLEHFIPTLRMGISRFRDVVACRLPRGVPLRCRNFLLLAPRRATLFKPHTKDDIFPLRSTKSPSHALNLVGRDGFFPAKRVAYTLPPRGRASVYCCLQRRLIALAQTTLAFSRRKTS